jgi:hypothetical protein
VEAGHVEAAHDVPAPVEVDDHRELLPGGGRLWLVLAGR